ncbi:hypothetical protein [Helicobacter cinaedi]|uniref:hypothetical protein n=1 Tax=Helicobacter cinaedi TaxID=213 RepID=UPI000D7BB608|nr:hypothetical protein [Helicobacter cinaedi]
MKLSNKCKVCGNDINHLNAETEVSYGDLSDDNQRDKARGFSIVICPICKTKYKTKPVNRTLITIIAIALGIIALLCHIFFDVGFLVGFFGIFVGGSVAGYIILDSLDSTFEQIIEKVNTNENIKNA